MTNLEATRGGGKGWEVATQEEALVWRTALRRGAALGVGRVAGAHVPVPIRDVGRSRDESHNRVVLRLESR